VKESSKLLDSSRQNYSIVAVQLLPHIHISGYKCSCFTVVSLSAFSPSEDGKTDPSLTPNWYKKLYAGCAATAGALADSVLILWCLYCKADTDSRPMTAYRDGRFVCNPAPPVPIQGFPA